MADLDPITRAEVFMSGNEAELTPITREEVILAGGDLDPVTRREWFLKKYRGSGGGGNPNTQQTIIGTAANPWGNVSYSELAAALASGDAHAVIQVQTGETVVKIPLLSNSGDLIYGGSASVGTTIAASSAAEFNWNANGSINYIRVMSGGQIQDYTAYAAAMQTGLTIYWHPMP